MKLYKIANDVPLNGRDNNSVTDIAKRLGKMAVFSSSPVGGALNAVAIAKDTQAVKIQTESELQGFSCMDNLPWQHDAYYIEHPRCPRILIPEQEYQLRVLSEVVADVSNYILDHISVKEMTFEVENVSVTGFGGSFPIKELDASAKLNKDLSHALSNHVTDSVCTNVERHYIWIDTFPIIKSNVDHGVSSMDQTVVSTYDFSADLGLSGLLGVNLGLGKTIMFHISYVKK